MPDRIRALIENIDNDVYVSVASLWEIAIKFASRGRQGIPLSSAEALRHFRDAGFAILDIRAEHAVAVESVRLPHGDPFDRLILAQALTEPLRLITKDRVLAAYSDPVISW